MYGSSHLSSGRRREQSPRPVSHPATALAEGGPWGWLRRIRSGWSPGSGTPTDGNRRPAGQGITMMKIHLPSSWQDRRARGTGIREYRLPHALPDMVGRHHQPDGFRRLSGGMPSPRRESSHATACFGKVQLEAARKWTITALRRGPRPARRRNDFPDRLAISFRE